MQTENLEKNERLEMLLIEIDAQQRYFQVKMELTKTRAALSHSLSQPAHHVTILAKYDAMQAHLAAAWQNLPLFLETERAEVATLLVDVATDWHRIGVTFSKLEQRDKTKHAYQQLELISRMLGSPREMNATLWDLRGRLVDGTKSTKEHASERKNKTARVADQGSASSHRDMTIKQKEQTLTRNPSQGIRTFRDSFFQPDKQRNDARPPTNKIKAV